MRISFLLLTLGALNLISSVSFAAAKCNVNGELVDCIEGTIECAYQAKYQTFAKAGVLISPFKMDDLSLEAHDGDRLEIDRLKRLDVSIHSFMDDNENFNFAASIHAWTFLSEGDFINFKPLHDGFKLILGSVRFDGGKFEVKGESSDGKVSLEMTCASNPISKKP